MKSRKTKGFTLIELVVVISIILVFAGFLIPKFTGYLDKAKEAKAVNTAKQLHTAAMASYGENDAKFTDAEISEMAASLTSAEEVGVVSGTDGKSVDITYISDGDNYKLEISDSAGTFAVYKGQGESADKIYP
ncbi:MAG: type II secretion system protein [Clostridiaceae bacterium]